MDSDRFDGLMRSFGQTRSRRQTLRGLAGALVALLAPTPVAAGNVGKPNSPHNAPKNPGRASWAAVRTASSDAKRCAISGTGPPPSTC